MESSMRSLFRLLTALLVAVLVALVALGSVQSEGSAQVSDLLVGPGESIQKAINRADPGDTIVVRGVHREDVVIRKNGIKLLGLDAVIKAPARADSPCSRAFGPVGICVLGDVNLKTLELTGSHVSDVSVSGFTVRNFDLGIATLGARDATFAKNHAISDSSNGIITFGSTGTKILSNVIRGPSGAGIVVDGSRRANAKVVGNDISGNAFGIFVSASQRGSIAGNKVHNNCVGVFFADDFPGPVGNFEVKGNTVEDNSRSCPQFDISGIGIGLLGTKGMEVTGNDISGNHPTSRTDFSGGLVLARGFGGTAPRDNSVVGNQFGRNTPDIFYDGSGSGNRFVGNDCDTSVPGRLCG